MESTPTPPINSAAHEATIGVHNTNDEVEVSRSACSTRMPYVCTHRFCMLRSHAQKKKKARLLFHRRPATLGGLTMPFIASKVCRPSPRRALPSRCVCITSMRRRKDASAASRNGVSELRTLGYFYTLPRVELGAA
eukprot:1050024-Pleurochrysis_carterae.AAC.1